MCLVPLSSGIMPEPNHQMYVRAFSYSLWRVFFIKPNFFFFNPSICTSKYTGISYDLLYFYLINTYKKDIFFINICAINIYSFLIHV
jgi:hypothetical protein